MAVQDFHEKGLRFQYVSRFLSKSYWTPLENEIVYTTPSVTVYGKTYPVPRLVAAYGSGHYTFSGLTLHAKPWTQTLLDIKSKVEAWTGQDYNFVLVNKYRTGKDKIGRHCDNEPCISRGSSIASLSLGAERTFVFTRRGEKPVKLTLENGSLLVMKPSHGWYHELPACKTTEPRINLTFRKHV